MLIKIGFSTSALSLPTRPCDSRWHHLRGNPEDRALKKRIEKNVGRPSFPSAGLVKRNRKRKVTQQPSSLLEWLTPVEQPASESYAGLYL